MSQSLACPEGIKPSVWEESGRRLDAAHQELKHFELGTETFRERRKELAGILACGAEANARLHFTGDSFKYNRRLAQAIFELFLTAKQPLPSLSI